MSNITPLEIITRDSMIMKGMTRAQYHGVLPYLKEISSRIEVIGGHVVYTIDEEYGGGVIRSSPSEGTFELTDEVSIEVIESLREGFKSGAK